MWAGRTGGAFLSLLLITAAVSGCVTKELDRQIAVHESSVSDQTQELMRLNRAGGGKPMDWNTAVKRLNERNLSLLQARSRVEKAKRDKENQWKSWLPSLGFQASILSSLPQLGALAFTDLTTSVVAPLNIPNPTSERARAFGLALSYLEAKDSLELSYRRQVTALYRIFSSYERQMEMPDGGRPRMDGNVSVNSALSQLERDSAQDQALAALRGNLAQLLNLPGENPVPIPSTRPGLDYKKRIGSLVPGRNYGYLAVRLSAYQLEGAILQEKGVELRRWPSYSVSGSSPALYNSKNDDGSSFFDADGFVLFGGLSKAYDLTGREVESINTARENTDFIKQNLRLRLDQDSRDWIRLRERYRQLLLKRKIAEERLELVRNSKAEEFGIAELTLLRNGRAGLLSLDQAKEQIELELWIWDDQKWN